MSPNPLLRRTRPLLIAAVFAAACVVAFGGAASAHHSFAAFLMTEQREVTGAVAEFEWTNPHSWLWITVADEEGGEDLYGFEGMSPNFLGRRGWSRNMVAPGDVVTVRYWPLKNGENGGMLMNFTMPDGTVMVNFGSGRGEGEGEE